MAIRWESLRSRTGRMMLLFPCLAFQDLAFGFCRKYGFYGESLFGIQKRRATDSYTPGGVMGKRPDYATVVYCNLIRHTYKKTPIIIGGIEASLRRLAHYDYWSNKVKRSILLDSGADLISYGMGEHSIIEIADALNAGIDVHDITFIDGTVFKTKTVI